MHQQTPNCKYNQYMKREHLQIPSWEESGTAERIHRLCCANTHVVCEEGRTQVCHWFILFLFGLSMFLCVFCCLWPEKDSDFLFFVVVLFFFSMLYPSNEGLRFVVLFLLHCCFVLFCCCLWQKRTQVSCFFLLHCCFLLFYLFSLFSLSRGGLRFLVAFVFRCFCCM